jgi:predicted DNA-binding ribbon-helix-helix protein
MASSRLVNRNVIGESGRTSMRLEPELWDALREICRREESDIGTMIRRIEAQGRTGAEPAGTDATGGRTSAVRVFIVQYFRALAEANTGV